MITTTLRCKAPTLQLNALEMSVVEHVNGIPRLAPSGFPSAPPAGDVKGAIRMWGDATPPNVVVSRSINLLTLTMRTPGIPLGVLLDANRWGPCVSAEFDGDVSGALLNGAIAIDLPVSPERRAA